MKMRPYQREALGAVKREWQSVSSTLVVMPTGSGKTVLFAHLIRSCFPRRALVLAHREELVFQAADKIHKVTGFECAVEMAELYAEMSGMFTTPQVVVSTIQTQCSGADGSGRMSRFDPAMFGLLIVDECFPAGTIIDGRPIETFKVGDPITTFDENAGHLGTSVVSETMRNRPTALCRVHLSDGRHVVCTPGHPFKTSAGYKPACALSQRDVVFTVTRKGVVSDESKELCCLWNRIHAKELESVHGSHLFTNLQSDSQERQPKESCVAMFCLRNRSHLPRTKPTGFGNERACLLFRHLQTRVLPKRQRDFLGAHQSKVRIPENETEQSDVQTRDQGESFNDAARHGVAASHPWRERADDGSATPAGWRARVAHGNCHSNHEEARGGIPFSVQGGHWEYQIDDCDRGRRELTHGDGAETRRREEGLLLGRVAVDRVEVLQQSCDGTFGGLCPDGFVYNLGVAGTHTYIANGLIVHNCHHATAATYRRVIEYYRRNPALKVLGVTATPDRADEVALGQVYETVAFDYEILNAIDDGWLVPIQQQLVEVSGLDFSGVRTTAGDLNGADLARVMEEERNLHEIAGPTIEIVGSRRALVFAASVAHAERLCDILNRHRKGCAGWVCGKTDKDERRKTLAAFSAGELQYIVNVGVLTEGFDDPGVEVIVMGRPTKSRSLYAQMVGRAMRPLPGLVDGVESPEERRMAIGGSKKPACLVVDFVGNSGRHKLMTSADILGGNVSDEAVERALAKAKAASGPVDMAKSLEDEEKAIQLERAREAARRANLKAKASWASRQINPFDVFQLSPDKSRGWNAGKTLSVKQRGILQKAGIDPDSVDYAGGKQLLSEVFRRWDAGLCSYKQAKILRKHGFTGNESREDAGRILDGIFGKRTAVVPGTMAVVG